MERINAIARGAAIAFAAFEAESDFVIDQQTNPILLPKIEKPIASDDSPTRFCASLIREIAEQADHLHRRPRRSLRMLEVIDFHAAAPFSINNAGVPAVTVRAAM